MKLIQLGGNRYKNKGVRGYAMVDDADYEMLSKHAWFLSTSGYAIKSNWDIRKSGHTVMTRLLLECPDGMFVDHIDGNRLNNQRSNLRLATKSQNGANRGAPSNNKSGFKGVHFDKFNNKWRAEIWCNNKRKRIGRFERIEDAARAYNETAKELFGEFAYTVN